ncbi:MAG TPA: ATP-binding protein, partial [Mycobacteriales bacterium]|nr:ATP-binding protein [Mycobacteriales bacterium]
MEINFTLQLPRDALSVPVVRRVLNSSMQTLGVAEDCLTDIEIALTEACTNVLDHAADGDEYKVIAGLDDNACVIEVIDTGRGFDVRGGDMARHAALQVRRHPRRAVALAAVTATLCATGVTAAFASASTSPSSGTVRLIVQTAKGLSASQRSAVVGRNGGTHKRDVNDLRESVVEVPAADVSSYLNRYKHDSSVSSVEVDQTRKVAAAPNDPSYVDQWALPKVSWDTAR